MTLKDLQDSFDIVIIGTCEVSNIQFICRNALKIQKYKEHSYSFKFVTKNRTNKVNKKKILLDRP